MALTPWGEMETLRGRQLSPGGGTDRREIRLNQRHLLLAAMVECCDRKGYEATSVADLLAVSGLSRGTFYAQFDHKLDCFRAAEESTVSAALDLVHDRLRDEGSPARQIRTALERLIDLIAAQPAAARMCLVESYAAGEPGVAPIRAALEELVRASRESIERIPGSAPIPAELARAIVGGLYQVVYHRLHRRRAAELPDLVPALWEWVTAYLPLPSELRGGARSANHRGVGAMPPFAAFNAEQRIIRAFAAVAAERGYPATTISAVATAASISQTTFYRYFVDKADLLIAALESSGAQMLAATRPSAARAPDWPSSVRVMAEASCGFLAAEPDLARLRMVEVYSAGPAAIEARDRTGMELISGVMEPGLAENPTARGVALEATVGAILGVFYEWVRAARTAELPVAAPLITYLVLAPMLGAERACEVANAKPGRARPR